MPSKYDGQVEIVAAPLIMNEAGQLLLVQSSKWQDKWLIPGGHIEYGETVYAAVERESEEEVGLQVKAEHVVNIGELVFDPDFHRKAHLIYIHIRCSVIGGELKIDGREITEAKWFDPAEALSLPSVRGSIHESIQNLVNGVRLDLRSRRW